MIYAYIRVSTDAQSGSSQEYEILHWTEDKGLNVDVWVTEKISGTVDASKRKLGKTIRKMRKGDLLICTEISRLGRNMLMIMSILNDCASRGVGIHTIKDRFDLTGDLNSKIIAFAFALAAEIERNLISQRTKEALADKRAAGVRLGRPPGSSRKRDMIMMEMPQIMDSLQNGISVSQLARRLGIHRNTLRNYILAFTNPQYEINEDFLSFKM